MVGLQFQHFAFQGDAFKQVVETFFGDRRGADDADVAAPFFGQQTLFGELAQHLVGVGAFAVDLVHGDDDRHFGGLGVVDGFDGLRHHAVIGGDDDDRNVGDIGTTGAHFGERGVTRGIDKGDVVATFGGDGVGTDVLGNTTGFVGGDFGVADRIEQLVLPWST